MNPLLILGSLAIVGYMVAMQSQSKSERESTDTYTWWQSQDQQTLYYQPDFRGTGASEEAYWSGYGEGRHIQVPGRIG
jgi:alpha/beta superfamily hydrolase